MASERVTAVHTPLARNSPQPDAQAWCWVQLSQIWYFFHVLTALVFLGMINGLILLPVLLSILGPRGEVRPKDNPDRLSTPTPEPSPRLRERVHRSRRVYPRMNSDVSLSTITEEPTQYSSHEIIVQPEVVIETTTVPGGAPVATRTTSADGTSDDAASNSSSESSRSTFPSTHFQVPSTSGLPPTQVTRVKATATVKVEVHTPIPGAVNQEHSYKSKRRKVRQLREQDSTASDSEC